jgi:hypothetical protein
LIVYRNTVVIARGLIICACPALGVGNLITFVP